MKVLVTGGSGFIGSHLIEALLEGKHEIRCLVVKGDDLSWIQGLKIEIVYGNTTDRESLEKAVKGVDYVYHLAAVLLAPDYEGYHRINYEGTKNIVDACIESGLNLKRFIFVSSVAAGGPTGKDEVLTEESKGRPISDYGRVKLKAEKYLESVKDKISFTIIRLSVVYGPREKGAIYSCYRVINAGFKPLLGKGISNICYVKDAVNGMILAARKDVARGKTYLIAQHELVTREEIFCSIEKAMGKKALTLKIPLAVSLLAIPFFWLFSKVTGSEIIFNLRNYIDLRHGYWKYSTDRAEKELGFNSEYGLEKGARLTADWYKQNGLL